MSLNDKYNDYSSAFGSLHNVIARIVENKELTQEDKDLVASLTPVKDETLADVKVEIDKVKQAYSDSKVDYLTNKLENLKSVIEKNDDSIQIGVSGIVDNKERISQINIDLEGVGSRVGDLEDADNVTSVKPQYYLSTSREELLGGSWLDKLPTKEEQQNKFLWFKYVTTYTDKTTKETEPVCISAQDGSNGLNGANGVDGKDGASLIYKGEFNSHPSNPKNGWYYRNSKEKKTYVFQDNAWYQMTIDGQDGIKGNDGANGKDGLSIEYKGELSIPPSNPAKNWTYKDSDNGVVYIYTGTAWEVMTYDGNNGQDGANGQNGLSVFITYNDSATQPVAPTGNGTTNGWHTNATSSVIWMSQKVASSSTAGTWGVPIKIQGKDGVHGQNGLNGADGANGKDGVSLIYKGEYTSHITSPQNGWYYRNTTDKKCYVYQSGAWYQMTVDGQDGIKGNDGKDGLSIEYKGELANPPSSPIKNWTYKDKDNGVVYIYTGIAWEVMTYDGNNGNDGAKGQDGFSVFITYNDSAAQPATPTGDGATGGWHTNSTSNAVWMSQKVASSTSAGTWGTPIKIKGDQGIQGAIGPAAAYVLVTGEQIFKYTNNFTGNPTPTSITLTATKMNTTATGKWQYKNGSGVWTDLGVTAVTISIAPTTGLFATPTVRAMTVRYLIGTDISDEITLVKVSDGAQGTQGNTGATGATGADAYTIILSNESNTFAGSTTGAIAGSTTCVITALKGASQVAATIGTISGLPAGMTAPITNNGTTTATFTPTVTTAMTTKAGVLTVPITVDGKSFTKYFSYSLALKGATGDTGTSVTDVHLEYAKNTSTTTAPTTGWGTSMPPYQEGYYLWIRTYVLYSNSSTPIYSPPICDQSWKANAEVYTQYKQLKDMFSWIVADGTSASTMKLTKEMYALVTTNVLIEAKKIELNGSIDINNGVFKVATNGNTKIGGLCDHFNSDGTTRGIFEVTSTGTLYSRHKTNPDIYTRISDGEIYCTRPNSGFGFDAYGAYVRNSSGNTLYMSGNDVSSTGILHVVANSVVSIESGLDASICLCKNQAVYTDTNANVLKFRTSGGVSYFDPAVSGEVRCGSATNLFHTMYSVNGVKTTSDRNAKENIEYLDYEEINPAAPIENDITTKDLLNFIVDDYKMAIYNYIGQNDTKLSAVAQDVIYKSDSTINKVGALVVDCEEATESETMLTMNQTQLLNVVIGAFQEFVKDTNNRLNTLGV